MSSKGKVVAAASTDETAPTTTTVVQPLNAFNTAFVLSIQNPNNPKEIAANDKNISRIGNLCDVPAVTKLNLSFNKFLESLDGIDQIPALSLKEFWCYGCSLRDLVGLETFTKLEVLYLQHNQLDSTHDVLKNMPKLRELRLDGNKLKKIESLQTCQSLRVLDLSHNQLLSTDGLSGLQLLQELKLNHNKLSSLSSLRGLPSLTEIDVSHNYLKSLDGIQHFLKLEIVRANYNHMVHLQFQPYGNSNNNNNLSVTVGKATVAHTATGSTPQNSSRSNSSKLSNNNNTASTNSIKSKKSDNSTTTTTASTTAKTNILPVLDKPLITELYLAGNKIRSITGLEMYSHALEILDISRNQITDIMNITAVLRDTITLLELHIYENPVTEDATQMQALASVISANCVRFTMDFQTQVISAPPVLDIDDIYHHRQGQVNQENSLNSVSSKEFHTWAHEESEVLDNNNPDNTSNNNNNDAHNKKNDKSKHKTNEEEDINELEDENEEINRMFLGPKPLLRTMLTEEQIIERANVYRNFLQAAKLQLNSSVFQFLYPDSEPLGTAQQLLIASTIKEAKAMNKGVPNEEKDSDNSAANHSKPMSSADKIREALDRAPMIGVPAKSQNSVELPAEIKAKLIAESYAKDYDPQKYISNNMNPTHENNNTTNSATITTTHVAMAKPLLLRSNSNNTNNTVMPRIVEGDKEVMSPPMSKPPRLASNTNLLAPTNTTNNNNNNANNHAVVASKTKTKLHAQITANTSQAVPDSPDSGFVSPLAHNHQNTHKSTNKGNSGSVVDATEVFDIKHLSSNVTTHGTKQNYTTHSSVLSEQDMTRQEATQLLFHAGSHSQEDQLRHVEEMLAFQTVKISKQKPARTMLLSAAENNKQHAHRGDEKEKDEMDEAEGEAEDKPLALSKTEKAWLERDISTPNTAISLLRNDNKVPFSSMNQQDEDHDEHDADYAKEEDDDYFHEGDYKYQEAEEAEDIIDNTDAVNNSDNNNNNLLLSPRHIVLPASLPFQPKSIGFDRRYLSENPSTTITADNKNSSAAKTNNDAKEEEMQKERDTAASADHHKKSNQDDNNNPLLMGSIPLLLTPRDLSSMLSTLNNSQSSSSVISPTNNNNNNMNATTNRAHSAPASRTNDHTSTKNNDVSSTYNTVIATTTLEETHGHNHNEEKSVPTTPTNTNSTKSTKLVVMGAKQGVTGGRLLVPSANTMLVQNSLSHNSHTTSTANNASKLMNYKDHKQEHVSGNNSDKDHKQEKQQGSEHLSKFQLPPDLQRVLDTADAKETAVVTSRSTSSTHSTNKTPRSPTMAKSSSATDHSEEKNSSPNSHHRSIVQHHNSNSNPVLFTDEDDVNTNNDNSSMGKSKKKYIAIPKDPVAAGKEQWANRMEAKILALSTKEALKAAVVTPSSQLPSPNIFHPQSR